MLYHQHQLNKIQRQRLTDCKKILGDSVYHSTNKSILETLLSQRKLLFISQNFGKRPVSLALPHIFPLFSSISSSDQHNSTSHSLNHLISPVFLLIISLSLLQSRKRIHKPLPFDSTHSSPHTSHPPLFTFLNFIHFVPCLTHSPFPTEYYT